MRIRLLQEVAFVFVVLPCAAQKRCVEWQFEVRWRTDLSCSVRSVFSLFS